MVCVGRGAPHRRVDPHRLAPWSEHVLRYLAVAVRLQHQRFGRWQRGGNPVALAFIASQRHIHAAGAEPRLAVGKADDLQVTFDNIVRGTGDRVRPEVLGVLAALACGDIGHRLGGPPAAPQLGAVLGKAGQCQQARPRAVMRPAIGFAEIVDAGPQELAGNVGVVDHRAPLGIAVAVLAADDRLARELVVVGRVEVFLVVVADEVERLEKAGVAREFGEGGAHRHRPCRILGLDDGGEAPRDRREAPRVGTVRVVGALLGRLVGVVIAGHRLEHGAGVGIVGIVDLVADAPGDDRGVVAVGVDHVDEVALAPLVEVPRIALVPRRIDIVPLPPLVLGVFPLVEGFIDDVETERVAEAIGFWGVWVVRHAHAVAAQLLERQQPSQPHLGGHRGAERPGILMQAHALERAGLAIDEKALLGVEAEAAYADGLLIAGVLVGTPAERRAEPVEVRAAVGP